VRTLYGVADNANDGYAIGISADEGLSWQPLMDYSQIQAIQTCVAAQCQSDCEMRAGLGQWSPDFCAATPDPQPVDGGLMSSIDGGAGGSGGHVADAAAPSDAGHITTGASSGGCHCELAGNGPSSPIPWRAWPVAGAALAILRRRRRRSPHS
jgi:MYXO-CTERM domain-containing protein